MRGERLKILKDNEEYLEEEEKKRARGEKSDEEASDEGFEDEEEDNEEGEETEQSILKKIAEARKKGKKEDEEIEDGEEDEEDDSDYEYTGGDLAIYDSALDDVDELLYVKETLERINAIDANYAVQLLSGMNGEEAAKFTEIMQTA